jgi:transposase
MPRHPEVFVRDLSMAEGQKLVRITRTAKDPVKLRRAIVVLMSAQGQAVGDIVNLMRCDDGYVRDVVHAFNQQGFGALDPKWSGGRPAAVDEITTQKVVAMARTDPRALGLPFSCWSLVKLVAHWPGRRSPPRAGRRSAGCCAARRSPSRPPAPGKPRLTRTSWPRCCGYSTSTTTRPPTGG